MNYTLIRAHKRSLSLQVKPSGELVARAPYLMPKFLIDRFIKAKSHWIEKRLHEMKKSPGQKIEYFTEDNLKKFIISETKKYRALMDLNPSGLRFTHVRSYWGTCAPSGVLSFNLALRYTPKEAVTYVVIHEPSHLRYHGHGKRFWSLVIQYCPNTPKIRKLLRKIPRSL